MRKGLGATIMTDQRPPLFSTGAPGSFRGWLLNVAPLLLTAWLPFFSIVTRAILKRESFFTGHTCRSDRFIVFLAPPATSAIRCSVVNNWRRQGEEERRRRTIFGRWTRGERDSGLVKQEQQATLGKLMNECKNEWMGRWEKGKTVDSNSSSNWAVLLASSVTHYRF